MPRRIAVVTTIYRYLSHAQHIADRFLVGYPHEGQWHRPDMKVVSLYVDQKPDGDLSADRAREFGFTVYPTIAEALRCGGDKLAVDAVLIIGEHGNYPKNEKGQILYPRYEFFKQCVEVFEKDGRAVPVYNDKHLSYSFEKAQWMVASSRRLKFPMLAGSSLPVTWRLPDLELPLNCEIEEALMVGAGGSDPMDYHALEAMQCMVERRKGGETGVKAVQMIEGDAVWKAGAEGPWSKQLLKDFNFAARVRSMPGIQSTQFFLSPTPNVTYSACLVSKIEEMFATGKAPYPVDRTLIVSGILEACLTSRFQGQKRLETPHLAVRYHAPAKSQHAQA